MNIKDKAKLDNKIMKALKISEIRHIVAHTTKGDLCLSLAYEGTEKDYRFILDAVPCDDKENKDLIELYNGVLYTI